ncbi:MAG: hypothetical protein V7636_1400 [Actinomycetota bacterium]
MGSLLVVAIAERVARWWYRISPIEPARPLDSDRVFRRTVAPGAAALIFGAIFVWIAFGDALHVHDLGGSASATACLLVGIQLIRIGIRWFLRRELISVGPDGIRVPGRGRLPWDELTGVLLGDTRNIVLVSNAPRTGASNLRQHLLNISSRAHGYRVWALPQTQVLSTRDFSELTGQLELAAVSSLPIDRRQVRGLLRAIRRRLRRAD